MLMVLEKYHILPREYLALDDRSKAFIIASINLMNKWDKERQEEYDKELERATRR